MSKTAEVAETPAGPEASEVRGASGTEVGTEVGTETGVEAAAEPDDTTSETEDALAPTVDLSEVRAKKQSGVIFSGVLARREEREPDGVKQAAQQLRVAGKRRRTRERREERRFLAPARRRRHIWLASLGAVAALALFVGVGVLTPLMAVDRIQLEGASAVDTVAVTDALARLEGVPLALVDDAEVHTALEPFPLIQRYAIERIPPSTLLVRIEERVPVVALERDEHVDLYDPAGVLVGRADERPEGVPMGEGSVTNVTSEAFRSSAEVLRDIPGALRKQVGSVTATSGQDVTFHLVNGVEVLWGEATQTQRKALVLASMIDALEDQAVSMIDVSSTQAPVFK
ncbi:MAG: FtsQ-type POTRA domain-containing protein [Leucobacter sp.]